MPEVNSKMQRGDSCEISTKVELKRTRKGAVELKEVAEEICAYPQAEAAGGSAKGGGGDWIHEMEEQLRRAKQLFEIMRKYLESSEDRLTGPMTARIETARLYELNLDSIRFHEIYSAMAGAADEVDEAKLSLDDLKADNDRLQKSLEESFGAEQQLERLGQVSEQFGRALTCVCISGSVENAAVIAKVPAIDAAVGDSAFDPIVFSHEVKLDGFVEWLAVCSDTSGFVGDRSGRVVTAESASDGGEALPQPCILASFDGKDHLQVLSVDGSKKLRCHCDIDWKKDIRGLHCGRQLLFIAQGDAVTVTDLSGRTVRRIKTQIESFGDISGIGGNAASVFVSGGNKIVAFSKVTGETEKVITLSELPDARLHNLVIHGNWILVTDWKHNQVHRVRIDTQQVVASHPTERSGLQHFDVPISVALDRRGRLLVIEHWGHTVRAVAADDGSLLMTHGVPGESGCSFDKLCYPWGLAVVTGGPREQLVVADYSMKRLVVLNAER